MELEKRLETLESKIIDALAEAKTARLLAEKALEKSQHNFEPKDPWVETTPTSTPTITMHDVTPKPTLSSFYSKKFTPKNASTTKETPEEVVEELWDEIMEENNA